MIDDLAHADDGLGIANLIGEGEKGEEGKGPKKPGEEEDEVNLNLIHFLLMTLQELCFLHTKLTQWTRIVIR